jgi:hypothetical protein
MHDRRPDNVLPLDAEPLSVEGYFCVVNTNLTEWRNEITFRVVRADAARYILFTVRLTMPSMDWRDSMIVSQIIMDQTQHKLDADLAKVTSEVIFYASELARILDEQVLEANRAAIEKRQAAREKEEAERIAARQRYEEQRRQEQEERAARLAAQKQLNAERKELLQWHLEDKFRLTRRHHRTGAPMKAVVFGTINNFVEHGDRVVMLTTSEKGKSMRIYLDTIISMEIKEHEADKRYSNKVIVNG